MTEEEIIGTIAAIVAPVVGRYLAARVAQKLWDELEAHGLGDHLADLIVEYDADQILE